MLLRWYTIFTKLKENEWGQRLASALKNQITMSMKSCRGPKAPLRVLQLPLLLVSLILCSEVAVVAI